MSYTSSFSENPYTKFENLILSKKNQKILYYAYVQMCQTYNQKISKQGRLLVIQKTIQIIKKLSLQHQYRLKKFSWTNLEILMELLNDIESKQNYWEKLNLSKELILQAKYKENNVLLEEKKQKEKKIEKEIETLKIVKPKTLSDLYKY